MTTWWGFEPSRPIPTEEGIKAHSRKGAFVKHWWATRWIEALERLGIVVCARGAAATSRAR